jgi:hypothetical protein
MDEEGGDVSSWGFHLPVVEQFRPLGQARCLAERSGGL